MSAYAPDHRSGSELIGAFESLRQGVPYSARGIAARMQTGSKLLHEPLARIAFGGHFNAGKSTLLNALLGRAILPVDDLPETGVDCWIASGGADLAALEQGGRCIPIPLTQEGIRSCTGLVGADGVHRPEIHQGRRLRIRVSGAPVPPKAVWIDTMGLEDDERLNDRLWALMESVDVLVWVVNSRQPLAEREQLFIARLLDSHGPDSVVFALNVYLAQDTEEEYRRKLERNGRAWHNKIEHFWKETSAAGSPVVFDICARGMLNEPGDFGRSELSRYLCELDVDARPVVASRLYRVGRMASELAADLNSRIAEKKQEFERSRQAARERKARSRKNAQDFRAMAAAQVSIAAGLFKGEAEACGRELVRRLTPETLYQSSDYGPELQKRLQAHWRPVRTRLIDAVNHEAARFGHCAGLSGHRPLLDADAFSVPAIPVPACPNNSGSIGKAVAAGAVAGSIVPGLGTLFGAVAGGIVGLLAGANHDVDLDRRDTLSHISTVGRKIESQASAAATCITDAATAITDAIVNRCKPAETIPEPKPPVTGPSEILAASLAKWAALSRGGGES
jgi:hypothetical protein